MSQFFSFFIKRYATTAWLHNHHGMDLDQDPQKYMEDHHIKSAWKLEILL